MSALHAVEVNEVIEALSIFPVDELYAMAQWRKLGTKTCSYPCGICGLISFWTEEVKIASFQPHQAD
jgi:hypothetical protein